MARSKKPKPTAAVLVEAITHPTDTRANIPTRELAGFGTDDVRKAIYARDPALDPQLVWKAKNDADRLEVPAVPIYVQEKIHPRVIVDDLKTRAASSRPKMVDLFSDFNGLDDFQQKLEFYQHAQHWTNRLILGDSLLVMASLAEKERLRGQVQCIYFDPPYGIKFGSNWQVSTRKRDVRDAKAEDLTRQPEQIKAFRDTYELGIHSYLTYIRDRLTAARELLTESGSIFFQIGDENVHLVRCLLDEVFGSENFCSQIVFRKTTGKGSQLIDGTYDVLLWYGKDAKLVKFRAVYEERTIADDSNLRFVELVEGIRRNMTKEEASGFHPLPNGARAYRPNPMTNQRPVETNDLASYTYCGKKFFPPAGRKFTTDFDGMKKLDAAGRLLPVGNTLCFLRYLQDFAYKVYTDIWDDTRQSGFGDPKIYVVQTANRAVERCLLMTTDPGDLVLDPTCGSGTTAYVAEQWGRRWITIDTSRVALALARTRLMAARFPFYPLIDTPEGARKAREPGWGRAGGLPGDPSAVERLTRETAPDIHQGFVYRTVPHVTLKSIANNPDIDAIHQQTAPGFTKLLGDLNAELGTSWPEWDVPRLPTEPGWSATPSVLEEWAARAKTTLKKWSEKARRLLEQWWAEKKKYRERIDAAIARHAETETLYDQPYEDKKIVRVCGPFTVESLSPHRELPQPVPGAEAPTTAIEPGNYLQLILDNLRTAGVKGMSKQERMTFPRLDPFPGRYIQAEGTTDADLAVRVSVGPELGTVGDKWIKEAALEAIQGSRADLLLVCAFAFESSVLHQTGELKKEMQFGKLRILPVRMNPDLAMFGDETGKELLKKTGSANLFTVFGEPDMKLETSGGKITLTIRGLDVFDPTTGEVRTGGTDDIACWFIDTDYDGQSFFVRQAYFCGAGDPYDRLKKALRAEIDEAEWSKLYATTSVPFDPPASGRIAVKVINHYGDEVLKVYPVGK
jgi:adenine-specific DNA-methyltransferase